MPHAGNFLNPFGTTVNTPLKTEVGRQVCFTSQILPPRDKATPQSAASWPRFMGRKSWSSTKAPLVAVVLETGAQARLPVTLRCFPEVQCLKHPQAGWQASTRDFTRQSVLFMETPD